MKNKLLFDEASRLYRLGFAIHWLHPKSKRPIENKWTDGKRKDWAYLKETYIDGLNVGVRTGSASKIGENYLACIDIDIKDPSCKAAAEACLKRIIGDQKLPEVRSGGGNGSRHLYCVTSEPFKMITVEKHKDQWEICIYSEGRQMVLPPSIHPNGSQYVWVKGFSGDLPEMDFTHLKGDTAPEKSAATHAQGREILNDYECDSTLDPRWLPEISERIRVLLLTGVWNGSRITDRSSYLLLAASSLVAAGLDRNAVLTILTDPTTYLGKAAYDHAKTASRKRAAEWLWSYTVKRAFRERDAKEVFKKASEYEEERSLDTWEVELQTEETIEERDWKQDLRRIQKGGLKTCLENVRLILENAVGPELVKRDVFAFRDVYGMDTPWGEKAGKLIDDDDIVKIRMWLTSNWEIEVGKELIYDALTYIACKNAFDPIVDWLEALPEWDGKKRIDTWLVRHFNAEGEPEYLAQVFRKWLVAMVGRAYSPGLKFDWFPIFEGAQGIGKSSFGRLLVGDKHFLDWLPDLSDKDSAQALQGMWAVEMGELATMSKNEVDTIKAYVTRTVDKFRPPFGRRLIESARRCVFYGTTNRELYLKDDTGNRRFKPVKVGNLNFKQLISDREQLFSEAKMIWCEQLEQTLELTGKAEEYARDLAKEKMVQDDAHAMKEVLDDFFQKQMKEGQTINPSKFKMMDLFSGIGPLTKWKFDGRTMQFASKALKLMGGENWKSEGQKVWKLTKFDVSGTGQAEPYPCEDFF